MGQYYYVASLDKQEYLHPHHLGDGLKLTEFGCAAGGTMTALAFLLAVGNGKGGGDASAEHDPFKMIGRWAGDRIAIVGDYAEPGDVAGDVSAAFLSRPHFRDDGTFSPSSEIHSICGMEDDELRAAGWTDISDKLRDLVGYESGDPIVPETTISRHLDGREEAHLSYRRKSTLDWLHEQRAARALEAKRDPLVVALVQRIREADSLAYAVNILAKHLREGTSEHTRQVVQSVVELRPDLLLETSHE